MAYCVRFFMCCNTCAQKLLHCSIRRSVYRSVSRSQYHTTINNKSSCLLAKRLTWQNWSWQKVTDNCQLLENRLENLYPICFYGITKEKDKQNDSEKKKIESRHDILKVLYATNNGEENHNQESNEPTKEEDFKRAWQRNMDDKKSYYDTIQKNARVKRHSTGKADASTSSALPENTFGMLNEGNAASSDLRDHNERLREVFKDDDEDGNWRKNISFSKYGRREKSAFFYNKKIKMFASQGKIKEAIAVFDDSMMGQDRVQPNKHTFSTLIACLAKLGYTRKAFQLYRQMKDFGLDPSGKVYSLLFNSCENCPMPDYGLNRANNLYHHMKDTGIELTLPTVKAAMRAFAKCGDFAKTFQILDETQCPLDTDFLDALLVACISDKKAGFKRALQVWMLMAEHNMKPMAYTYNLFARCMRDSGIGEPSKFSSDLASTSGRLSHCLSEAGMLEANQGTGIFLDLCRIQGNQPMYLPIYTNYEDKGVSSNESFPSQTDVTNVHSGFGERENMLLAKKRAHLNCDEKGIKFIPDDEPHVLETVTENCSPCSEEQISKTVQNLTIDNYDENLQVANSVGEKMYLKSGLIPHDDWKSASSSSAIKNQHPMKISDLVMPSGRLALLGGMESFLFHMKDSGADPDVKTFTLLLSCLPNNKENEVDILKLMESHDITPEIDFFNDVLMRRNMRNESHTHEEILQLISRLRLTPNMRTYAAVAMSCHKEQAGFSLLEDMKAGNLEPTDVIISHLVFASGFNFKYKLHLLQKMEELNLKPDERMIKALERSIVKAKQKIVTAERKGTLDWFLSPRFQKGFSEFLLFYRPWLKRTEIHKQRHPWDGLEGSVTNANRHGSDSI